MLIDNHGRHINYLRLAVTDRCNLRCLYCMPAAGLRWLPRKDILSYEEMERLLSILSQAGITKLRFTGGEPFMRKDFIHLLESVSNKQWFEKISITTNGTLLLPHIPKLKQLGIHSVNLSLDTVDKQRFETMTRRNDFNLVMESFHSLLAHGIRTKVNAIILDGKNDEDILSLAELAKQYPVDVRFIEEMPFNGTGKYEPIKWNAQNIVKYLRAHYPDIIKLQDESSSTVASYHIPGFKGAVGVIAAYTRSFCGTCNRLRLNAEGQLKTCLYEAGGTSLRDLLRNGATDDEILQQIRYAVSHRFANGFEAERHHAKTIAQKSMASIGG
ncbi:MAG TPA: GTP 3',8-cyclase MoaA [Flavobacteriales bacterium]